MIIRITKQVGLSLGALALVAASCGGSTEETGSPDKAPLASGERAQIETTATVAPATTTTTEATTTTLPDQYADIRPELTLSAISAGPISLTPTLCDTDGWDYVTSEQPYVLGAVDTHLFTEVDRRAKAFILDLSNGCTLTENPDLGEGGYVGGSEDRLYSIQTGENGNVMISHFGDSVVIDTNTGLSYTCDSPSGYTVLSHEGDRVFEWWPGFDENGTWKLSDTRCAESSPFEVPGDPGQVRGGWQMSKQHIGLGFRHEAGDESWNSVGLFNDEGLVWQVDDRAEGTPYYLAQVAGMVRCGNSTCVNQDFRDSVFVIDDTGTLLTELDSGDLSNGDGDLVLLTSDPAGNIFGLISVYVSIDPAPDATEEDPDPSVYFNFIVSLEATS